VSLHAQEVEIDRLQSSFTSRAREPIRKEYSYKYLHAGIERLAFDACMEVVQHFTDQRGFFIDSLWRVDKGWGVRLAPSWLMHGGHGADLLAQAAGAPNPRPALMVGM